MGTQAPQYTWICQYCGLGSPCGTLHCASCGFPAHTSALELERAKRLGSVPAYLADLDARDTNWRTKPIWKKAAVIVAAPLFVVGIVLLEVGFSGRSIVLAAAAIGAGALLLWLSI